MRSNGASPTRPSATSTRQPEAPEADILTKSAARHAQWLADKADDEALQRERDIADDDKLFGEL